jgi:hypothetical protein
MKRLLNILLFAFLCMQLQAQEQDLRLRNEVGLKYRINKKSDLSISYRLDLKENISQFRRSNFSFAYRYKINKWLSSEVYYRYMTNYDKDENRFRLALSADKKIFKKTKIDIRTMFQHDIEYFDGDYLRSYSPDYVWRNRLKLERDITKKIGITIFSEPFINFDNNGTRLSRWRNGVGASYTKKRYKFSAEYFHQYEFIGTPNIWHVFAWGVDYDITRVIRPKKKKKK